MNTNWVPLVCDYDLCRGSELSVTNTITMLKVGELSVRYMKTAHYKTLYTFTLLNSSSHDKVVTLAFVCGGIFTVAVSPYKQEQHVKLDHSHFLPCTLQFMID